MGIHLPCTASVIDSKKIKYVDIVEPFIDKPTKEFNRLDYKFTKIELGKQSQLGCLQDAQDALTNVSRSNHELWKKKNHLKEEVTRLNEVIR